MKLLQVKNAHPRNTEFIIRACALFGIDYHNTHVSCPDNNNYDIIWAPTEWIDPDNYPNTRFIFGPHFWVFPDTESPLFMKSRGEHAKRCIYVCLSDWNRAVMNEFIDLSKQVIPHLPIPFGIQTEVAIVPKTMYEYDCIIYCKARHPTFLNLCAGFLRERNMNYVVFRYGSYEKDDYFAALAKARFVIWIGSHESQGFALEECLASNTPIYVYDVTSMKCEFNDNRYVYEDSSKQLLATSAPYWSDQCGIKVRTHDEFISRFPEFLRNISSYTPAAYVQATLTDRVCFQRILDGLHMTV